LKNRQKAYFTLHLDCNRPDQAPTLRPTASAVAFAATGGTLKGATNRFVIERGQGGRVELRRLSSADRINVLALVATSSLLAALSSASPVGGLVGDRIWCAAAGAVVPLIACRARRLSLLWAGGIAAVVGIGGNTASIAFGVALLLAISLAATLKQREAILGAVIGALSIQCFLRGPSYGPFVVPTLVAIVAFTPLAVSAWRAAHGRQRRVTAWAVCGFCGFVLLAALGLGTTLLQARTPIDNATASATAGISLLSKGETDSASTEFTQSETQFAQASNILDSVFTWPARVLPLTAPNWNAVQTAAASGMKLASTAAETARDADYRLLTIQNGTIDLDRIASFETPVETSLTTITVALNDIDGATSPWLFAPVASQFATLKAKVTEARDQADLALAGIRVAPELFGGEAPKRWFLAFGSPGESRNAGGFVGAYATLVANDGRLSLEKTGSIGELYRLRPPTYDFTPPQDWEERYSTYNVPVNLGNVSASPSWPVDASVMAQLYPQTPGGAPIDGAMYVDPAALAGLLSLTGAITVPGLDQQLDATNVEQYLLRDQYIEFASSNNQRRDILGDVASATFTALTTRPLPSLSKISDVLGPIIAAQHLQIASFAPTAESFLDRTGISGRWATTPGSDYLSVRSANMLNNKIDAFLWRTIDVDIQLDEKNNIVHSTVTVTLRNDAPTNGLPPYLIGNDRGLAAGTNRNLLTLYSPLRFMSVTIDGEPAGVQIQTEFNGPVLSLPVDIDPGATVTVVFELSGAISSGNYNIAVFPQATANPDALGVRVREIGASRYTRSFAGPLDRTISISAAG